MELQTLFGQGFPMFKTNRFFFFNMAHFQSMAPEPLWGQKACGPGFSCDEEGSILCSSFLGCKICCNVLCAWPGGDFRLWWRFFLLTSRFVCCKWVKLIKIQDKVNGHQMSTHIFQGRNIIWISLLLMAHLLKYCFCLLTKMTCRHSASTVDTGERICTAPNT